jgi:DNA-directed RNA polymerase specialized sigma24 family protein
MGGDSDPLRLRRGEPDAFDALLARYQNRLYRYLIRLTVNRAVAEDLSQGELAPRNHAHPPL